VCPVLAARLLIAAGTILLAIGVIAGAGAARAAGTIVIVIGATIVLVQQISIGLDR
jgi:hypothetical protein